MHHLHRDAVKFFVVDGAAQSIILGGFFKIGVDRDIQRVLVPDFLLLVVEAVVRKKFQPFE